MLTREQESEARELAEGKLPRTVAEKLPNTPEGARLFLQALDQAEGEQRQKEWEAEQRTAFEGSPADLRKQHAAKAKEIAAIRGKLANTIAERQQRAAAIAVEHRDAPAHWPDAVFGKYLKEARALVTESQLDEDLATFEKRHVTAAAVLSEPGPYGYGSPNSWVSDRIAQFPKMQGLVTSTRSAGSDMRAEAVAERLEKHAKDVRTALITPGSRYGRQIREMTREGMGLEGIRQADESTHRRLADEQLRALTTGGGATASASGGGGAAFVSPAILLEAWANYRSPFDSFVQQCNSETPLPDWGMEVYIPQMTGGSEVTSQTEGSGVAEKVVTATFNGSPVVNKSGQIQVSQQYLDRAGPGMAGDVILFQQIKDRLAAAVDTYALSQALTSPNVILDNSAFALATTNGVGGFLGDVKTARNKAADASGVRSKATHIFAVSDLVNYLSSYSDGQNRPVFAPQLDDNALPIRSLDDPQGEGYSGYNVAGLYLHSDDNISTYGTTANTQVLVARLTSILIMRGAPIPYCYPPTLAESLEAVLGVRQYVAVIPLYPKSVSVITGSAYTASTFA
jgi:hypothetical protein